MSLNLADPCFLICGLDCFYTGNAKNYGSCPLDKMLSSGYLANPCLCFWTTNFIHWLAVHCISSCPVDNLIQWITLSSILNNRSTCLPQFPSLDMVKPNCLCSDTMFLLSIMRGGWSGRLDWLDTIILSVLSELNLTSHLIHNFTYPWKCKFSLIHRNVYRRI